jgi:hypothetical protein
MGRINVLFKIHSNSEKIHMPVILEWAGLVITLGSNPDRVTGYRKYARIASPSGHDLFFPNLSHLPFCRSTLYSLATDSVVKEPPGPQDPLDTRLGRVHFGLGAGVQRRIVLHFSD